jgi:Na+/alanine symporter
LEDPGYSGCGWLLLEQNTAFVETTLAQIYKEKHLGEFQGGPAFYIERIRREMVLLFFAGLMAAVYCCLEFKRTLLQME